MSNVVTDPLIIPLGIAAQPLPASFLFWQVLIYILIKHFFFRRYQNCILYFKLHDLMQLVMLPICEIFTTGCKHFMWLFWGW